MPKRSASAKPEPAAKKAGGKTQSNEALAAAFDELKMYEMKSTNHHAAVAYDKVAKAIRAQKSLVTSGAEMAKVAGVGKASVAKIDEYVAKGSIEKLEGFRKTWGELPPELTKAMKSCASGKTAKNSAKDAGVKPVTAAVIKKIKAAEAQFETMSNDSLKTILRQNGATVGGNKAELVRRCAEGKTLGAFPKCPLCHAGKPKLDLKTGIYSCPGYMDDDKWAPCIFKGGLTREAWQEP
jgi:hypothetical protein